MCRRAQRSCRRLRRSSFAGLAASLVVWLLSGGTLALHHPFDEDVLEQQINDHACDTLIAPAQLALRLDELDLAARLPSLRHVIGLWRAPGTGRLQRVLGRAAGDADGRLFVRRSRAVRRTPDRHGRLACLDQAGTAWCAARIAGVVDRGRYPADAPGHAWFAGADGPGCRLCAPTATERLADHAAAARFRRYGLFCTARPLDRSDQHHRTTVGHHGGRRLPVSWRRTCRNGLGGLVKGRC